MKKLTFLFMLAFSTVVFGQDSLVVKPKLSVVSADKMNVVYRGMVNPISIAVNDGKQFTASAPGLSKDEHGNYVLRPGSGTEVNVMVSIKQDDGTTLVEKHPFRIKPIPSAVSAINGNSTCDACLLRFSIEELSDAEISVHIPGMLHENLALTVTGFLIKVPGKPSILVEGNKFTPKVLSALKKVNYKDEIVVFNIRAKASKDSGIACLLIAPITFKIYKKEIVKPIRAERDSLHIQRRETKYKK
jgi:hypothetical protein